MSHTSRTHRPFSVFSAGLPVSRCVTSQDTNFKEPALPSYQYTEPYLSFVLSSILFVWKSVSVSKNGVEIFHIIPWMWHKTTVNDDDQNGQYHPRLWSIWKVKEFRTIFLKNEIIKIIKLIVVSFASDPLLVQGFAYNMVQYVMAGCQNERRKNDSQTSE